MTAPQPPASIDPRLLADELASAVAEFNRLAALACENGVTVIAEIRTQPTSDLPDRAVLAVQIIRPH